MSMGQARALLLCGDCVTVRLCRFMNALPSTSKEDIVEMDMKNIDHFASEVIKLADMRLAGMAANMSDGMVVCIKGMG